MDLLLLMMMIIISTLRSWSGAWWRFTLSSSFVAGACGWPSLPGSQPIPEVPR